MVTWRRSRPSIRHHGWATRSRSPSQRTLECNLETFETLASQRDPHNRAPPLPETALFAMVGWSIFHRHHVFGLSLLLSFYGLLRTGELHSLCSSDTLMTGPTKPAVVSLGFTSALEQPRVSPFMCKKFDDACGTGNNKFQLMKSWFRRLQSGVLCLRSV